MKIITILCYLEIEISHFACGVKTFMNKNANVSLVDEEVSSNEAMD